QRPLALGRLPAQGRRADLRLPPRGRVMAVAAADTDYGLLIDGEEIQAGAPAPLWDPSTGEQYGTARIGGGADVDRAVAAAKRAFEEHWANSVPAERG